MCGIAAIIGHFPAPQIANDLRRMLDAERHRGPDDEGTSVIEAGEAKVALGNRRLAILDVSPLGHQPMANSDTGDVLVYNGEIYNSPELRSQLEVEGFRFRGRSDTEVLLNGYQYWGVDVLKRLKGMFAFALWDNNKRQLILARDHLGIKPLYYSVLPGKGLVCASEIRALLSSGLVSGDVSRAGLAGYLAYGAVQEPLTILRGVFSLPAASWMAVNTYGEIKDRGTYWQIPQPDETAANLPAAELIAQGRSLLKSAVKRHLLSDVPVGVFLSSGLDSTAVLKLAHEVSSTRLHAFTVSTPDAPEIDEAPFAKQSIQGLDISHHVCPVDAKKALEWAGDSMNCMDQPSMDGLNTYIVSRAVREAGIKVALSGQGGDEIFGGYPSFRQVPMWFKRLTWLRRIPGPVQNALVGLGKARMNGVARGKVDDISRNGIGLSGLYFQFRRLLSDQTIAGLGLNPKELDLTPTYHDRNLNFQEQVGAVDPTAMIARLESVFYLGNTLLRDGDVFGMANSLEIRVPMLDRDLAEWAFSLPGDVLLPKGAPNKFLLRQICADLYTDAQSRQSKLGFNLPFAKWLQGPLRDVMDECLGDVKASGLLNPSGVDKVREAFFSEPESSAWSRIWALVTLGQWLKTNNAAVSTARAIVA